MNSPSHRRKKGSNASHSGKSSVVYLLGHGEHIMAIADVLRDMKDMYIVGYLDKHAPQAPVQFHYLGTIEHGITSGYFTGEDNVYFVCTHEHNMQRHSDVYSFKFPSSKPWLTVIHPTAVISPEAKIGHGCFIGPNVMIDADTVVGDWTIIGAGAVIGSKCMIGDFVSIGSNVTLGYKVRVESYASIGAGSAVTPKIEIGDHLSSREGKKISRNAPVSMSIASSRDDPPIPFPSRTMPFTIKYVS